MTFAFLSTEPYNVTVVLKAFPKFFCFGLSNRYQCDTTFLECKFIINNDFTSLQLYYWHDIIIMRYYILSLIKNQRKKHTPQKPLIYRRLRGVI